MRNLRAIFRKSWWKPLRQFNFDATSCWYIVSQSINCTRHTIYVYYSCRRAKSWWKIQWLLCDIAWVCLGHNTCLTMWGLTSSGTTCHWTHGHISLKRLVQRMEIVDISVEFLWRLCVYPQTHLLIHMLSLECHQPVQVDAMVHRLSLDSCTAVSMNFMCSHMN